ncbi:LytR/AlgR family response regulator transcription factor [Pedobacter glucosidilyticus]|uniref:LytR/AlgR family response regulator transcription factor n=1 Tax=Pedobacter glucosidilyticus TaxID=1122941 RepID=UPI0026E9E06D|nr:LytTR family DNA-binding domain-containing protein [Pedobacter glucosidilyticus]
MLPYKAIIVDDEAKARSLLRNFLEEYCPQVLVIDEAADVKTAVKLINKNEIDLVFLDIEMPNENGFALFDYFNSPKFKTIFCTAYSEYAIKAFEVSAVDYILKPIGIQKLIDAVNKLEGYHLHKENQIKILQDNLSEKRIKKLAVNIGDGMIFLDLNDVFYFEADGSYTHVHHKEGKHLAVKKIKYFEDLLYADARFFRIHRSYLINTELLKKYSKKEGLFVSYDDRVMLPISRERKEEFEHFMQQNNLS